MNKWWAISCVAHQRNCVITENVNIFGCVIPPLLFSRFRTSFTWKWLVFWVRSHTSFFSSTPCLSVTTHEQTLGFFQSAVQFMKIEALRQRFPSYGTCTPRVHLPVWRGTFKVINRKENILTCYLFSNICTYIGEYHFKKSWYVCCWIYIYYYQSWQNILSSEIVRGTCSSAEMLKGYMVRERLGTPAKESHFVDLCRLRIQCIIVLWTFYLWITLHVGKTVP